MPTDSACCFFHVSSLLPQAWQCSGQPISKRRAPFPQRVAPGAGLAGTRAWAW